jgi:hypothetical protein
VADELGTAVLRIVADDSAARESLNVLRRDVEQLTTRATRASRGAGGSGDTAPGGITRQDVRRFNLRGLNAALESVNQDITAIRTGRRINIGSSWNKALGELAQVNEDITAIRVGRQLNISSSWNKALGELTQVNKDITAVRTGRRLNIGSNWNKALGQLTQVDTDLRSVASAKALNIRTSWGKFLEQLKETKRDIDAAARQPPSARGLSPAEAEARRAAQAAARRNRDIASNALIGGAFPLLFGQGLGASVGGAAGGAAGGAIGGQFGFGLSLVGTAIGSQLDAAVTKAQALGEALRDPISNFAALQEQSLLSSSALERNVQALISVGAAATAAAAVQTDLAARFDAGTTARIEAARRQEDAANRSGAAIAAEIGSIFGLLGSELAKAGRRVTQPLFGIGQQRPPDDTSAQGAEALQNALVRIQQIENRRLSTQGQQLRSIAAQAQGYGAVAASLDNLVKIAENAADVDDARRRLTEVPGKEDDPTALAERAKIQNEINKLVNEGVRIQQQYNETLKAAAVSSERQLALVRELVKVNPEQRGFVQQRFDIGELERELGVTRAASAASPADQGLRDAVITQENQLLAKQITLQDELLRFQRDRAATSLLQVANYRQEAQELDRQFAAIQRIAAIPTPGGVSIAQDSARQREQIRERFARAQANEANLAQQLRAEQLRGGDGSAERILQIQLQQVNAARETRNILSEGAAELTQAGEQLAQSLRSAVLDFTKVRSDPQGLNRFLSPQAQGRRAQQDFERLLPRFREAQGRFFQLTGQRAPDFSGPTSGVNAALRDFINAVDREFSATEALNQTTSALNDTSNALVIANLRLAEVTAALAAKDWNVAVNVQGGSAQAIGDANNRALS